MREPEWRAKRRQLTWRRCGLAALSGLLLTVLFPPFTLAPLGWVALTPLLLALDDAPPRIACLLGWITGTIESLGVTGFWMFHAAHDYFHLSALAAAAFTVGVNQLFVAAYYALFGLAVGLMRTPRLRWLIVPALFVTTDYARAHLLGGNPWTLLGSSQTNIVLIQLCDLTGVYGLSFLLALSAVAVAGLRRTRVPALVALLLASVVWLYGEHRLASSPAEPAQINVALVQGDLSNDERGQPQFFAQHLTRYIDLTRAAGAPAPDLIIWPENAIGFFPEANPELVARITDYLGAQGGALLTGAPRAGGSAGVAVLYNSAYLFTAGGLEAVYDKRILLPFVERLPLRPNDGPYLPGTDSTIFSVSGRRFGTLICYEAIYPELARQLVEGGAEFLVNISNDSWFEAGAGPGQHFDSARFRAVENHVSLVRVTNSGVSGIIDPSGREILRLTPGQAGARSVGVPLGRGGSFYTRHGDIFAWLCIGLSAAALLASALGLLPQVAASSHPVAGQ